MIRFLYTIVVTTIYVFSKSAVGVAASTSATELHPEVQEIFFLAVAGACINGHPIFSFVWFWDGRKFSINNLRRAQIFIIVGDKATNIWKIS